VSVSRAKVIVCFLLSRRIHPRVISSQHDRLNAFGQLPSRPARSVELQIVCLFTSTSSVIILHKSLRRRQICVELSSINLLLFHPYKCSEESLKG
jgi:hypothetical protein